MEKQKNIWIINYYAVPPEFASNSRHLEFAKNLESFGYDVTIFSSGFLPDNNIDLVPDGQKFIKVKYEDYDFIHIKVRHYIENGINRMFSIFQFAWRILRYRNKFEKPDIIIHNIHAPFDYLVSTCAKKLKTKYIAEAWDLWPESFVTFGLISAKNPLMKWAYSIERKMYERANKIIFSFEGGLNYLREKKWTIKTGGKIDEEKVHYINNGVNIGDFNRNKIEFKLNDDDIENSDIFKIIYMGSIRLVNDVKQLIDAVNLLKEKDDIRLYIYGDGDQRNSLIDYCKNKLIYNVVFKEKRIPLTYVSYVISNASLNILNYQKGFGDYGISSGKLFQSLAAGKPIICNIPISYDDVVTNNNLGIADSLDTPEKYANAILKIYNMNSENYESMCQRVKKTANQFDYKVLSAKLIKVIENV